MTAAAEQPETLVLVADDDPDIRSLVVRLLERDGYAVVSARDGDEALELARRERPDVAVLDVGMPGRNGYVVCRELQGFGAGAPAVVFLTARTDVEDRVEGLDAGAVDYPAKPFQQAELRARVRVALRTKQRLAALEVDAASDALTGLFNRRRLDVLVKDRIALARRQQQPLACAMVDLDNFKQINDQLGHAAGDNALRSVAQTLRRVTRASDIVARYGGDEFVVVASETDAVGAVVLAERLRIALAVAADASVSPRASIGVAGWSESMQEPDDLYAAADRALYRAKALGRDRVVAADEDGPA